MDCAICLEPVRDKKKILKCSHEFHLDCIDTWMKEKRECPVCRNTTTIDEENHSNLEESESYDVDYIYSATAEVFLCSMSLTSILFSTFLVIERDLFLLFLSHSLMCIFYIFFKINVNLVTILHVFVIFYYIIYIDFYSFYEYKMEHFFVFFLFLIQYVCVYNIEKNRIQ